MQPEAHSAGGCAEGKTHSNGTDTEQLNMLYAYTIPVESLKCIQYLDQGNMQSDYKFLNFRPSLNKGEIIDETFIMFGVGPTQI